MRRDDGFALATTIALMTIALLFCGVIVSDAVTSRQRGVGDLRQARALQAADAGLQSTLYRLNQLNISRVNFNGGVGPLSVGLSCLLNDFGVGLNAELAAQLSLAFVDADAGAQVGATCPGGMPGRVPPLRDPLWESTGDRSDFKAFVTTGRRTWSSSPTVGQATLQNPEIVVVGREDNGTPSNTGDDVYARIRGVLRTIDPFRAVEATGDVIFRGISTTINGNVRADEDFVIDTALAAVFAGGNILSGGSLLNTASFEYNDSLSHPLLTVPLPAPYDPTPTDDDTPLFTRDPVSIAASKPDCGGAPPSGPCPSSTFYNAANHRLTVGSGSLTLAAGDYVFCSVAVASGATLRTSTSGGPVRIFVDSPQSARCSSSSGTGNLDILGQLNPGVSLTPERLQIYSAGNGSPGATHAYFGSSTLPLSTAFFFYGPDTNVEVQYSLFTGSVIGHDVTMTARQLGLSVAGVITQDLNLMNHPLAAGVGVWRMQQYVQCRGRDVTRTTPPNRDC